METARTRLVFATCLITALMLGCQGSNQQTSNDQTPPAADSSPSGKEAKAGHGSPAHRAASAPKVETVTVPEGTPLDVRLTSALSSGTVTAGSQFDGTLASPLMVGGVEVAPVGSAVTGTVTNAVSSGRLKRPAELALTLASITLPDGQPVQLSTSAWSEKGQSHKKRDAEMIGGGAGVGALIGALAGKGKGAAIGAAIGAGAGTAGAAATGKKEIVLPAESKLTFTLTAPVTVTRRRG